jgi:pimeloyl-ACP methyl ester carboxylesterase
VPVDGFSTGRVDAAGVEVGYVESGSGEPVVVVAATGLDPLCARLARGRRVTAVALPDGTARDRARVLGAAAAALGLGSYPLVGAGAGASAALWHAIDAPAAVSTLVLLAPDALGRSTDPAGPPAPGPAGRPADAEIDAALAGCGVPTLVLFGDQDDRARHGRRYRAALPRGVFGIVYRAGRDLVTDRPAAVSEWVGDFLDRGPAFAVTTRSALLHQ